MIVAAVVSAAKPWTGSSLTTLLAHRLDDPPAARGGSQRDGRGGQEDDPDAGRPNSVRTPAETRARVMMPIVFWASFEPWLKAM